jgi:hypothetical protein
MLDAGGLDRLLKKRLPINSTATQYDKNTTRTWPPDRSPGYRLCLLGAVVMRLGCVIRPDFRQSLEDLHTKVGFSRNAQVQLRHALNVYVNGTPYNFRDKLRPTASSGLSDDHIWGDISECMIDLGDNPEPAVTMFSRLLLGPLLKCAAAGDNEHPQNACGNCGRKKALDGSPCRPCTDCGHRLYCSRKWYACYIRIGFDVTADSSIANSHTVLYTSWFARINSIESWVTHGPKLGVPSTRASRLWTRKTTARVKHLDDQPFPALPRLWMRMSTTVNVICQPLSKTLLQLLCLAAAMMEQTASVGAATAVSKHHRINLPCCAEGAMNSPTAAHIARRHTGLSTRSIVYHRLPLQTVDLS